MQPTDKVISQNGRICILDKILVKLNDKKGDMDMKKLVIATLAVASLALNSNYVMSAVPLAAENVIQPVGKVVHQPVKKQTHKGIEYIKETSLNEDGSANIVVESWTDPVTHDHRTEILFKQPDGTISKVGSRYLLDNGTKFVEVLRDKDGKAISGKYCILSNQEGETEAVDMWKTFEDIKYVYSNAEWKNKGTEKSADGKTLVKLFGTNILKDDIQPEGCELIINEYAQIEEDTGLPVKLSVYFLEDGENRFRYASAYEYKYIEDNSVFDLSGIPMKQYTKMQWVHGVEY